MEPIPEQFRPSPDGMNVSPFHALIKHLRHPELGCPWDKSRTLASMAESLEGEAREAGEALRKDDRQHQCEELGDVFLNVMLATVIAEDQGRFTWKDVIEGVTRKLVRRHPHVFGDQKAESPEEAVKMFNAAKAAEKKPGIGAVPPAPAPAVQAYPAASVSPSAVPPPAPKTPPAPSSAGASALGSGAVPTRPTGRENLSDRAAEMLDGWPNFCGDEPHLDLAVRQPGPFYLNDGGIDFAGVNSAWGIALHMQQPLIPAGGDDLKSAAIISNLKYMMDHQGIGDNHNAGVFHWCYKRIGELVPELVNQGKNPRVMLDYAGCLLYGLPQMGLWDVLDTLRTVTSGGDNRYRRNVEWLACTWGHAVAPSTPVQDFRLQVKAWQHHFGAIFGWDALARVRGFSPAEMALPNHPDVAYEYVKTLRDCGLEWVMIQEHSIEQEDGRGISRPYVPHRLVAKNQKGEEVSIIALIKTQGSDTKLVAQMQPLYEARSKGRENLAGKSLPPYVVQIGDGENGGVMMNEFPGMFRQAMSEASGSQTPAMNGTEYLEQLRNAGFRDADFPVCRPAWSKFLFDHFTPGQNLDAAIAECKRADGRFNMEGGSWTNNISWTQGYENVLGPMEKASALFAEKTRGIPTSDIRYRKALFHLLCSQTSCYRYWGQGIFTDYGAEICRRAIDILTYDF